MKRTGVLAVFLIAIVTVLVLPTGPGAAGPARLDLSTVRILAIAPFADEPALTRNLADFGALRLTELLRRGPLQIVGPEQVAAAMGRLGITRADLISPSRTVEVGRAVGADAVLTGRLTFFNADGRRDFLLPDPLGINMLEARVDVDVRVLQVETRLVLYQAGFSCTVQHRPARAAMDCLVQDVAHRLSSIWGL